MGGDDPYSASKAGAEYVAAAYRAAFFGGATIATARAGNVIGGGDRAKDRVLPDLLRAFEQHRTARIRNPDAIRPWQHVVDPLCGYLALAQSLADGPENCAQAWNFGPDATHEVPVARLADITAQFWGDGARWQRTVTSRNSSRG